MKRRQLLKHAGILGLFTTLSSFKSNAPVLIPNSEKYSPGGYVKLRLGKLEMLVVTDGHIYIHPPQPIFAPGIDKKKVKAAMIDNFMPDDAVDAAINVLVIKKEKRIIIIDTGSGSIIGDQAGRFLKNLNLAGIQAHEITDVFITHLHGDHIGGILDSDGLTFKNAKYYLSQLEYKFWMSKNPDFSQSKNEGSNAESIALARNIISAINDKLTLYSFGETILDCIKTELAEGHTPGHPVLTIFSQDQSMRHIVDTVHTTLLISNPEWGTQWDIDFHKGVSTRKRLLEEQVVSKGLTMSCHLPWPGLGYITKNGNGYNWVQMPISTPYI